MSPIDPILLKKYQMMLQNEKIPKNEQSYFLKWLRYYLDFCHKYGFEKTDSNSLHPYINKTNIQMEFYPKFQLTGYIPFCTQKI